MQTPIPRDFGHAGGRVCDGGSSSASLQAAVFASLLEPAVRARALPTLSDRCAAVTHMRGM